jgi:hypothetical protein
VTAALTKFGRAKIETGVIIDVHVQNFTVDVRSPHSRRRWLDVPLMASYLHHATGEGIYVMPEVGATVWVCQSIEVDSRAFVLGFGGVPDQQGTFRANRRTMNPGDIYLGTRDRNSITLRRGGIVQIQATPLSQRIYVPLGNVIRDICEAYDMQTFAGSLQWQVDRTASTTTGDRPTRLKVLVKELADDKYPIAELTIGDNAQTEKALLLEVFDKGGDGRSVQVSLQVKKNGDVLWDIEGKWSVEAKGDYDVVSSQGNVSLESKTGTLYLKSAGTLTAESSQSVVVKSPLIQLGSGGAALNATLTGSTGALLSLELGGGGQHVIKGEMFIAYFQALLTALTALTPYTTGVVAGVATGLSKAIATPAGSPLSTKVSVG